VLEHQLIVEFSPQEETLPWVQISGGTTAKAALHMDDE
jgi:hypothetical protein